MTQLIAEKTFSTHPKAEWFKLILSRRLNLAEKKTDLRNIVISKEKLMNGTHNFLFINPLIKEKHNMFHVFFGFFLIHNLTAYKAGINQSRSVFA